jgi:CelD/BcsL family acetyltransferase involved in cellulose biosynthesis
VIDSLAPEWRALCAEGQQNQPFYRPEWISAYLRAFEPEAKIVLIAPRRGGRLRGVLPLVEDRLGVLGQGVTRLRAPANVHSNRLDLIHGAGDGDLSIELIWRTLVDLPGWDVLDFRDVPENGAFLRLLQLAERDGYATATRETLRSPHIPLEPFKSAQDVLAPLDGRFRRNLRSRMRKLNEAGSVRLERHFHANQDALNRFFKMEKSGWKGQSQTAIACQQETVRFYSEIATQADRHGYFALYELWCGDQPVAASFGMALDGHFYQLKSAIDESFKAYGPGHLVIGEIMRDLVGRGYSEFDLLGHDDQYKGNWTNLYWQHYHCHVFAKGPAGRALHAWTERFMPVGRRIHRRIRGMGGGRNGRDRGAPEPAGAEMV